MKFWNNLVNRITKTFESPIERNKVDQVLMHSLPTMKSEIDPEDLTLENAYRTRWIWYHTILAILIFFSNIILLCIFLLLAIKL